MTEQTTHDSLTGLTISAPLFFKKDETINYAALGDYLEAVCANKYISAVYSMAYNTRYRMLSDKEVLAVNKFIVEVVKRAGIDVYVGHPYIFSRKSLAVYLEQIAGLHVDGVSMLYPERYYGIDEPIIDFLKMPSQFGIKTVFHEMKLISGFNGELINWPKELLNRVFGEVPLAAVKEDSKDDDVTNFILKLCKQHRVHCVLAGGGKVRAEKFFEKGLNTWLNGSTMFLPHLIDRTYLAFINDDKDYKDWYLRNIERPFFDEVVSKHGWHVSHKAALEFFGFGPRFERFPHATLNDEQFERIKPVFERIASHQ